MPRQGLNCTLSYPDGALARIYRVRCSRLTRGFEMIADESEGRRHKAFYPHFSAPSQFGVQVDLIGQSERRSLNAYLMRYASHILDPGMVGTPQMTVTLPSRNFTRVGVPVAGIEFGTRTGEMVFSPTIVFETSGEPLDWDQAYRVSRVHAAQAKRTAPVTEFFYPTGTQLRGDEGPVAVGDGGGGGGADDGGQHWWEWLEDPDSAPQHMQRDDLDPWE